MMIVDFAKFARNTGCTVRFIEFMPLDGTVFCCANSTLTAIALEAFQEFLQRKKRDK